MTLPPPAVLPSLLACALLLPVAALRANTYTDGQDDTATYDTSGLEDGLILSIEEGTATQSGILSGDGYVAKEGAGTIILSGANTHTGNNVVYGGTLVVAHNSALGNPPYASAATAVGSGSTIRIQSGIVLSQGIGIEYQATLENLGTINAQLGMVSSTGGKLVNTGTIDANFGDAVHVQTGLGSITNTGGTLQGSGGVASMGIYLRDGGTIRNEAGGLIKSTGHDAINGGELFSGSLSANTVTVENFGASTISGDNYGVNLYSGGSITNSGGSIIEGLQGGGIYISGGEGIVENLGTSTISGLQHGVVLENGGSVTNEGTITGNQETGPDHAGILFIGSAASLVNKGTINGGVEMDNEAHSATLHAGSRINGNLNMGTNSAATLTLDGSTGTTTFSTTVTGTTTFQGTLVKQGSGTWALDLGLGSVTSTQVNEGTLLVNGTLGGDVFVNEGGTLGGSGPIAGDVLVADGGFLAPGNSPGQLQIGGGLTLGNGSTVLVDLSSISLFDQLVVGGVLAFDGALEISLLNGYRPAVDDEFSLFDAATFASGTSFDSISFDVDGYEATLDYETGTLTITSVPEPALTLLFAFGLGTLAIRRR